MAAKLRLFSMEAEECAPEETPLPTVPMSLAEILPILTQAYHNKYAWLQDFLSDEVMVTEDLFEVLRSFRCYRPSA